VKIILDLMTRNANHVIVQQWKKLSRCKNAGGLNPSKPQELRL